MTTPVSPRRGPVDPRLARHVPVVRPLLAASVLLGLLEGLLLVVQGRLLADLVGAARPPHAAPSAPLLVALGLVVAGRAVGPWLTEVVGHRMSRIAKAELRHRTLARIVQLGPEWLATARRSELTTLLVDGLDALDPYLGRYLPTVVLAVLVPLAVIASLALADPLSAVIVALTVPLVPLFMALVGWAAETRRRRHWLALARLAHAFGDLLAGLPTLEVHGRARAGATGLRRASDAYRVETMATLRVAFLSALVLEMAASLSVALVAVGVGLRLVDGQLDLATGLFVLIVAPEAYLPLRQLGALFHASEPGLAAAERAVAILEASPPGAPSAEPGGALQPAPGWLDAWTEVRLESISVERPERGISAPWQASAVIRPGRIVALVGPSGAGKSTLFQVVLGLRRPSAGRIVVLGPPDGSGSRPPAVELATLDPEVWRRGLAWLPQHPWLAPGTVADNLRLARPEGSDLELAEALARVGLPADLLGQPVGEGGKGLSSGQRRRVALARTLLTGSRLLLLDEPTAGLDAAAEATVLAAIAAAAGARRAVVMATHRQEAAAIADEVATIEGGPLLSEATLEPMLQGGRDPGSLRRPGQPALTGATPAPPTPAPPDGWDR